MRHKDFVALVSRMRAKQKLFFLTRDKQILLSAKVLERKVDELIRKEKTTQGEDIGD